MKTRLLIVLLIIINLFVLACRSIKMPVAKKQAGTVKLLKTKQIYDSVVNQQLPVKNLLIKFGLDFENSKTSHSVDGTLRMAYDSIIWISITPALGIEVMRVFLTPDSVKYLDQINNVYFTGNYDYLSDLYDFDFDFYDIQAILTNEIFEYPETKNFSKSIKKYKSSIVDGRYNLQSQNQRKINRKLKKSQKKTGLEVLLQNIFINPDNFKMEQVGITDFVSKRSLDIYYQNFDTFTGYLFPKEISIELKMPDEIFKVKLKYNKVIVNKEILFPFEVSDKYKRINEKD